MESASIEEDVERSLDALCAEHPDRRASIVCPHCGTFACGDCTVDTLWGDVMCESCRRHGRAQYPLPWEDVPSPATFVQTAYLVFADTGPLFGAFPAGALKPALAFAAAVTALSSSIGATLQHLFAPRHWAAASPGLSSAFFTSLALDFVTSVLLIALSSGIFHAVALLLGGRGSYTTALRACCYLAAIDLLDTLGDAADVLMSGSTLVLVLGAIALFFVAWALTLIGEQRYALTRARAVTAALSPIFGAALLVAGLIALSARLATH
jgi:hypothetical protein